MPTYTHGGDIWAYSRPMLDFSANLHPLGMPPAVAAEARSAVAGAVHYPHPLCPEKDSAQTFLFCLFGFEREKGKKKKTTKKQI